MFLSEFNCLFVHAATYTLKSAQVHKWGGCKHQQTEAINYNVCIKSNIANINFIF